MLLHINQSQERAVDESAKHLRHTYCRSGVRRLFFVASLSCYSNWCRRCTSIPANRVRITWIHIWGYRPIFNRLAEVLYGLLVLYESNFRVHEERVRSWVCRYCLSATLCGGLSLYTCGMFAIIDDSFLACSSDAIFLIYLSAIPTSSTFSTVRSVQSDNGPLGIASVEIKAAVSGTRLAASMGLSTAEFVNCTFCSATFLQYTPKKQAGQVLQQKFCFAS